MAVLLILFWPLVSKAEESSLNLISTFLSVPNRFFFLFSFGECVWKRHEAIQVFILNISVFVLYVLYKAKQKENASRDV